VGQKKKKSVWGDDRVRKKEKSGQSAGPGTGGNESVHPKPCQGPRGPIRPKKSGDESVGTEWKKKLKRRINKLFFGGTLGRKKKKLAVARVENGSGSTRGSVGGKGVTLID